MRSQLANLRRLVLPFGAGTGIRIVLDGTTGTIEFYDETNTLVGSLSPDLWFAGQAMGARAQLDPFGGFRIFNDANLLTALIDSTGIQVREPVSGLVMGALSTLGLRIAATNGNSVEIVANQTGQIAPPKWAGSFVLTPGTTNDTPALVQFTTDDLELRYVADWSNGIFASGSFTPPAGYTEELDEFSNTDDCTLNVTLASRQPAVPNAVRTFTNTRAHQMDNGHTIVLRSDGVTAPSIRSLSDAFMVRTGATMDISLAPPAGVQVGDVMVACIALGNDGGSVPASWSIPDGWNFLGAGFQQTGAGPTQSMLGSGVWFKVATADDVALDAASGVYTVTVNVVGPASSTKKFHGLIAAIQDVAVLVGGADIRFDPASRARAFATVNSNFAALVTPRNITFDSVSYDPAGLWVPGPPSSYVVPQSGLYRYSWRLVTGIAGAGSRFTTEVRNNGAAITQGDDVSLGAGRATLTGEDTQELDQGDVLEVFAQQVSGALNTINGLGSNQVYFCVQRALST